MGECPLVLQQALNSRERWFYRVRVPPRGSLPAAPARSPPRLLFPRCARRGIPGPDPLPPPCPRSRRAAAGPGSPAMARRRVPRSRLPPSPRPLRAPLSGNGGGRGGPGAAHLEGAGPGRARPSCGGVSPLLSRSRREAGAVGPPPPGRGVPWRPRGFPLRVGKRWRQRGIPAAGPGPCLCPAGLSRRPGAHQRPRTEQNVYLYCVNTKDSDRGREGGASGAAAQLAAAVGAATSSRSFLGPAEPFQSPQAGRVKALPCSAFSQRAPGSGQGRTGRDSTSVARRGWQLRAPRSAAAQGVPGLAPHSPPVRSRGSSVTEPGAETRGRARGRSAGTRGWQACGSA